MERKSSKKTYRKKRYTQAQRLSEFEKLVHQQLEDDPLGWKSLWSEISGKTPFRQKCTSDIWKVMRDKPLGKGRHGKVFRACFQGTMNTLGEEKEDCEFAAKITAFYEPLLPSMLEEMYISIYMGQIGVGPYVYDTWFCLQSEGKEEDIEPFHWLFNSENSYMSMIMDIEPGVTLNQYLSEKENWKAEPIARLVRGMCRLIQKMHKLLVSHGDLHGGNVMVLDRPGRSLRVRFIDFGSSSMHWRHQQDTSFAGDYVSIKEAFRESASRLERESKGEWKVDSSEIWDKHCSDYYRPQPVSKTYTSYLRWMEPPPAPVQHHEIVFGSW